MAEADFAVLTSHAEDRAEWIRLWTSTGREPFAHPAYVAMMCGPDESPRLIVVKDADTATVMPIIVRPLARETWADDSDLMDATSPYGYGGPYSSGATPHEALWPLILEWMRTRAIATLIGRLALDTHCPEDLPQGMAITEVADNVVVDLTRRADDQWRHYEHKVRKNVSKAVRAGLSVEVRSTFTDVDEFAALYRDTMDRRGAATTYYFGRDFFGRIADELKDSLVVAEVRQPSGRLVSAELVLTSDRYAYSFLGGTQADAFPHAPNDLLKHAVIEFGRESGRLGYVLGGGYRPDDGIFRYKRGFDRTGVTPFRRLEMSAQHDLHGLLQLRLASERRLDPDARLDSAYFPQYRAPLLTEPTIRQDAPR